MVVMTSGAELLADARDEHFDGVRIAVEVLIVDMLDEFGPADHLALVVHEVGEELVLLSGELDRLAVLGDLAGARIEADVTGDELGRGISRRAANECAQACDQLLGLERLGEVIVGAGVEPCDLVRPAVACGQHQHRHLAAFLAPAVEHGEPVDLGQAEIEDHRVVILGRAEVMAVLAVGGEVDRIAGALERRAQLPPEVGFVFDDQNAHCYSPDLFIFAVNPRCGEGLLIRNNWEVARKCQLAPGRYLSRERRTTRPLAVDVDPDHPSVLDELEAVVSPLSSGPR